MNFSSEERWPVLRQLYELHGVPIEWLAITADKRIETIENRAKRESWQLAEDEPFKPEKLAMLVGRLVHLAENCLCELVNGEDVNPQSEKQLRSVSSLAVTCHKSLALIFDINKQLAANRKNGAMDDPADTGEDILALRQDVEAFIDANSEEEIDPALSRESE